VRAFEALTLQGQSRRLRELALDALREYDLDVVRCSFVHRAFNTVFRVDAIDGAACALRMSPRFRIHADGCEVAEAAWTEALRREAGFPVPRVVPARDGSVVVWASAAGVPDARSCVLFEWVRGHRLREHLRADHVHRAGALAALVHEHAAAYVADPPAGVIVADHVLYFRGSRRLEELRPMYGSLLDDAVDRAQHALDRLWRNPPHRPHLLHGDLQPGNMMVCRNDVVLIDFQDLVWGFDVQDVSIALLAFERLAASGPWPAAFRSGYETVRPWPAADPETASALRAARRLNELDYGLTVRVRELDAFVARNVAPIAEWMTDRTSRSPR
jgi:Ser/Thr protein kinase RdoA (MazF antagonist)